MVRGSSLIAIAFVCALAAPPAVAQWAALNAVNIDVRHQSAMAQVHQQAYDEVRRKTPDRARSPQAAGPASAAKLGFKASNARRQLNYARFVEQSRRADPAGADGLAETLRNDPVSMMVPELAKYGLRVDNVADAYTVYWVEAWQAAHGVDGPSSRETADAVKEQAANALLATPEFARASDVQKQEFADALLVQALLIAAARDQNKGNAAVLQQIAAAVRQGARASGLDLDAMALTPDGFVPV